MVSMVTLKARPMVTLKVLDLRILAPAGISEFLDYSVTSI